MLIKQGPKVPSSPHVNFSMTAIYSNNYDYYMSISDPPCPFWSPFFGHMGVSMAMVWAAAGAAIGTARAGSGIAGLSQTKPELVMKALIPGMYIF